MCRLVNLCCYEYCLLIRCRTMMNCHKTMSSLSTQQDACSSASFWKVFVRLFDDYSQLKFFESKIGSTGYPYPDERSHQFWLVSLTPVYAFLFSSQEPVRTGLTDGRTYKNAKHIMCDCGLLKRAHNNNNIKFLC